MSDISEQNKNLADSELDEYGVWVKNQPQTAPEEEIPISDDEEKLDSALPDFSFLDNLDTSEPPVKAEDAPDGEISLDEFITDGFSDGSAEDKPAEEITQAAESEKPQESVPVAEKKEDELPDGEIDLDSFMGSSDSPAGDSSKESHSSGTQDVDLSEFGLDGDIPLDAFMDMPSESAPEKNDTVEDSEPLDIDLSFSDEPAAQTEEDAQEETVFDDFAGTELAGQTKDSPKEEETEDFDALFDSIVDETPEQKESVPVVPEASSDFSDDTQTVDLSEFGLDDDDSNQNPVLGNEKEKVSEGPVDYVMNVDTDDSDGTEKDTQSAAASVETDDEDDNVIIEMDETAKPAGDKKNDEDFGAPDNDFDIDSILNSVQDEGGNTVDLSSAADTSSKTEDAPEDKFALSAEETAVSADDFTLPVEEPAAGADEFALPEPDSDSTEKEPAVSKDELAIPEEPAVVEDNFTLPEEETSVNEDEIVLPKEENSAGEEESEVTEKEPVLDEEDNAFKIDDFAPGEKENALKDEDTASGNESVDIDDFMNGEGFTDGGFGVTGPYDEEGNQIHPIPTDDDEEDVAAEDSDEPQLADASVLAEEYEITADDTAVAKENAESAVEESEETPAEESAESTENTKYSVEENDSETQETVPEETYSVFEKKEDDVTEDKLNTMEPVEDINGAAILKQISAELANLRNEISSLKTEFEDLKKNPPKAEVAEVEQPVGTETAVPEENAEQVAEVSDTVSSDGGFFSESDEDDTIALSGDELNNILTSAQFTAENIEPQNPDLDEPVDFGGKELEEPVFDETEPEQEETEENIPDEISVPKADDILVESSATDMMDAPVRTDETVATEPQDFSAEPEEVESIEETEPVEEAESAEEPEVISEDIPEAQETAYSSAEETVEKETEQQPQETGLESLSKPIDVFKEDDEVLEKGIGEEPVGEVFSNWQSKDETPDTEDIPETEDVADKKEIPAPAAEEKNDDSSDIPSDMKQEIKSVLSYMDQLLENLPEEKIAEFARSEQFETYKKLFAELGLS